MDGDMEFRGASSPAQGGETAGIPKSRDWHRRGINHGNDIINKDKKGEFDRVSSDFTTNKLNFFVYYDEIT